MRDGIERGMHYRYQYHWSPALALRWPFLAATNSVRFLQAILAAATVAYATLLAALARACGVDARISERTRAVALLFPPLVAVGFGEFWDLGLLPPLALGWWLALETALVAVGRRARACPRWIARRRVHRARLIVPVVAAGAALRRPRPWTNAALVLSAVVLVFFSPLNPLHYLRASYHDLADARAALAAVSADATLATHDEWYAGTVAWRSHVAVFGNDPPAADYLAVARGYPSDALLCGALPQIERAAGCGEYRALLRRREVTVFVRSRTRRCAGAVHAGA
jgi:hypothetical protein